MCGTTPPWEITTSPRSLFNLSGSISTRRTETVYSTHSSSLRMASCKCRGTIRCFLLSRAALPASSRISAARYSRTAARYTEPEMSTQLIDALENKLTRCTGTDTLSVVALLQQTMDTTDW